MQCAMEIGSNCNFQVSQSSVDTYSGWGGEYLWYMCTKFLREYDGKKNSKSVYICRIYKQT